MRRSASKVSRAARPSWPRLHRVEALEFRAQSGRFCAEGKVIERLHDRDASARRAGTRAALSHRDASQRAARWRRADPEKTPEPAARREAAMLHEILRFKVRARVILRPGAVDDRQLAFGESGRRVGARFG